MCASGCLSPQPSLVSASNSVTALRASPNTSEGEGAEMEPSVEEEELEDVVAVRACLLRSVDECVSTNPNAVSA